MGERIVGPDWVFVVFLDRQLAISCLPFLKRVYPRSHWMMENGRVFWVKTEQIKIELEFEYGRLERSR